MKPRSKYRIVYQIPGIHRVPREAVLTFFSEDEKHYFFTGRPAFGTQTIEKKWVTQIHETNPDTPHYLNRRYFGETRVL